MKNILLKVASGIIMFQGLLQAMALFVLVTNQGSVKAADKQMFWAGCALSAIYVFASVTGAYAGLRDPQRVKNYPLPLFRGAFLMILVCVIIIGINAVTGKFSVNQFSSLLLPVVFLAVAINANRS